MKVNQVTIYAKGGMNKVANYLEGENCQDLHLVIRDGVYFINHLAIGQRESRGFPIADCGDIYYTQNIK